MRVEQFELEDGSRLGAGGAGTVISARVVDAKLHRELSERVAQTNGGDVIVALKVFKGKPGRDDLADIFNQEVAILSALKGHPNVA